MVPFKHYTEDVISDTVNDRSEHSQICDGPSAATVSRWKRWIGLNTPDIDGHLKSIGYRELGFSKELMNTSSWMVKNHPAIYLQLGGFPYPRLYIAFFTDFDYPVRDGCRMISA